MDIYTLISSKAKKRKSFESTQEYKFFVENRHLLDKLNKFPYVSETQSDDFKEHIQERLYNIKREYDVVF